MSNYFKNSYRYIWRNTESLQSINLNQNAALTNTVSFTIPTLMCQGSASSSDWCDIGEINTITRVYKQNVINGVIQQEKTLIAEKISGGVSVNNRNDDIAYVSDGQIRLRNLTRFSYSDASSKKYTSFSQVFSTFSQISHISSEFADKTITFTTDALTEDELVQGFSLFYSIECVAMPDNADGMISYFSGTHQGWRHWYPQEIGIGIGTYTYSGDLWTSWQVVDADNIKATTSFYCKDMSNTAEGGPFLMKGVKYNAYELFRKALLSVDIQLIDNEITGLDENYLQNGDLDPNNIQYPIIVDPSWINRMKSTQIYETVLETKNLWEIFQQIGKYLHAEPRLSFAADGTDRLMLSFKQLGKSESKTDTSIKITIFNSQALSQYFASFDSYVSNLFSPQNLCREFLVPKCSDGSYLVSNDTAELQTTYGISEIVEFNLCYNGVWKDAMGAQVVNNSGDIIKLSSKIYEKSIYDILTSEYKVSPSKADSLYFSIGDTKIGGLNYTPPSANNDQPYALKKIVRQLFGVAIDNLLFNNLMFEIVYRTQDDVRLTQIRPDMEKFVKTSNLEKYPHHEQFYNQLDKIPDSERFSSNMWGQLVRSGNAIIQCQEFALIGEEKEEGDLYIIEGLPYYVTEVESEFYNDCVLQKVTYSAYWNEISMITSQNSENRMYEVSEKSLTRRESRPMDFFKISSTENTTSQKPIFLNNSIWKTFIKNIIFCDNNPTYPNYAYVKFIGDKKRQHTGNYGQLVPLEQLFPSSEINRLDPNNIRPVESNSYSNVIVPLLRFPKKDGILFEFDMEDNFQAGTFIDTSIEGINTNGSAYFAQQPARYVDIMGRADLYQFKLFNLDKSDLSLQKTREMIKAPSSLIPSDENSIILTPSKQVGEESRKLSIALDKDCREAMSFNYQINLLDTDIEFITFSNLFGEKNGRLKLMLYNKELGMFDQVINLASGTTIADNVEYSLDDDEALNNIKINITEPENIDMSQVKSLIFYDDNNGIKDIYLVANVGSLADSDKLKTRYIYPVYNNQL